MNVLRKIRRRLIRKKVLPVKFGDLRTVEPICREFGSSRGKPIDRYYIEKFLQENRELIKGSVLEVGDDTYTAMFGNNVTRSDVLHVAEGNPKATVVDDLANSKHLKSNHYDCIILTQTLHLLYDLNSVVQTLNRILKADGVILLTVPGISQVKKCEWGDDWNWALTEQSLKTLFQLNFPASKLELEVFGNVLVAASALYGLCQDDLTIEELEVKDMEYQFIISLVLSK